MQIPDNPNNPGEWFALAREIVADEGIFSRDQIAMLWAMTDMIENGVVAAIRNTRQP